MAQPLSTLASRALNAPSEAEYRAQRQARIMQAALNLHPADWWRAFMTPEHEAWMKAQGDFLLTQNGTSANCVLREYRKLAAKYQAVHSFKDAGVGK